MGLVNEIILDTEKTGEDSLPNAYFRVPRVKSEGFEIGEGFAKFNVEIWKDYETREEVVDGKKPLKVISVWVYKTLLATWVNSADVMLNWDDVVNQTRLDTFVHDNIIEMGVVESLKCGFLTEFYLFLKTQTNFSGIDMTTSTNHP